jgi:hypothetical protein
MDDNSRQTAAQAPSPTAPSAGSVIGPQQTAGPAPTPPAPSPKPKSKKLLFLIIIVLVVAAGGGGAAWALLRKDKPSTPTPQTAEEDHDAPTQSADGCAFKPKTNHQQNEGLYSVWRKTAQGYDFDIYLPCKFHPDFEIRQLGASEGDTDEEPSVFLTFHLPEPAMGEEDGLTDESQFYVQKLPAEHNPPSQCIDPHSSGAGVRTSSCDKIGDSKYGPVYQNNEETVYATIDGSLIMWVYPPYTDAKDILDVMNSLQKVDPATLEFFNS